MDAPKPPIDRQALLGAAAAAALNAHAPYSRFRVGAAVFTERDTVITGCNVENASYGLCLCAERAALAGAVAQGARNIRAIAVACIDAEPKLGIEGRTPCGSCRQWLLELAPNAEVHIQGVEEVFKPQALLPHGFTLG